jgi:DNA-binding GntR family transcriptional regulator
MSRRHQVHAGLVGAIARGDADQTRRLMAGHSLPTASDADR